MNHLIDPGLWAEIRTDRRGGPALFLDRDGVIVEEVDYLHRVEDVRLTHGGGALIAKVNALGIPVVMATNQAGVGRGYYTWDDFRAVQDEIHQLLAVDGARIDAVYACGYRAEAKPPLDANHDWLKPNPGMLVAAAKDLGLELNRSWMVGDRVTTDLKAGKAAGVQGGALVATGHGSDQEQIKLLPEIESATFKVKRIERLAMFDPGWLTSPH